VARVPGGVTITTTVPGQAPTVQTLLADDVSRPISDDECRGSERTTWSTNGRLLFARASVTCADSAPRTITGLGMMTAQGQWLDIRTFRIDGRNTTRVSRYDRADNTPVMGHHLTIEEIKEASRIVSPTVVEAAIAETRPPLTVKSRQLLDLADARVPTSVIDVMVAVAYPKQFIVEPSRGGPVYSAYGLYDPLFDAGYWPSYYYSPFAYGYIGRYDPIVFPGYGSAGGGDAIPPRGTGRAINGEGYTRVRPNTPERPTFTSRGGTGNSAASGSATATSRASSSSSDGGGSSSSSSSSSGGGGGGSGASPQGYSSGGSDGGGRTAQPR
jgi:hypothetical protein